MSGLSRTPGKRVWVNSPPRVRIPPSPPQEKPAPPAGFCFQAVPRPLCTIFIAEAIRAETSVMLLGTMSVVVASEATLP